MIIINKETLAKHGRALQSHADHELAMRREANAVQQHMLDSMGSTLDNHTRALNQAGIFGADYWLEIDRTLVEVAGQTQGREIYDDLQGLVTVIPLGKTVRHYQKLGDISKHVAISMDGQTPQTFDHVGLKGDGDPIPMFTAGFGIDFRHWLGLQTENLDLMLQSQRAKLNVFYEACANYALNGSGLISEHGYAGEGLKNHRNTVKLDLTGVINLTTATADEIIQYFVSVFGAALDANNVAVADKLWVSKEIRARLSLPYSSDLGIVSGSIERQLLQFFPRIREIGTDYSLNGNEYIAYAKSKQYLEIPTGQAVTITPLPRLLPRDNFNNDIASAFGVQVKTDSNGRAGVFYGANLT